jgi:hypothetical protein
LAPPNQRELSEIHYEYDDNLNENSAEDGMYLVGVSGLWR